MECLEDYAQHTPIPNFWNWKRNSILTSTFVVQEGSRLQLPLIYQNVRYDDTLVINDGEVASVKYIIKQCIHIAYFL